MGETNECGSSRKQNSYFEKMKRKKKNLPKDAKYIQFPSTVFLDANLIIKLNFDDITKFFFFNEYIKAYLEEDSDLMPFIKKIKEKSILARKFRFKENKRIKEERARNY